MSQTSSDSPDGPPPPRQRPPAARTQKDSSELDLWDFDDDAPAAPAAEPETPQPAPQAEPAPEIKPRPRAIEPSPRRASLPERENPPAKRTSVPRNPSQPVELKRKPVDDIGELDGTWAEPENIPVTPEPAPVENASSPAPEVLSAPPVEAPEPADTPEPDQPAAETSAQEARKETSTPPHAASSLRNLLRFNKAETIGLGAFALVLLVAAIVILSLAKNRLPTRYENEGKVHFPVKGSQVTLKAVTTFWREPIEGKDLVRRDTKLIPVVKIESEGGPAALRVFFKDDKGKTIGDSATRPTSGGTIEIAATAGLDDIGMHAAYRTGETLPWKVEILEAPSTESSSQQFRPLAVIPISTDRH